MQFSATTIGGHGRGRTLGFPTINMTVPTMVADTLAQGVHAARAVIDGVLYTGMLYYGSAPVFGQKEVALEMYLFDVEDFSIAHGEPITIEPIAFVRGVANFASPELLVAQMQRDEQVVRLLTK